MANYAEDIYQIIDRLEENKAWKEKFKMIYSVYFQNFSTGKYKNVHFWKPSPLVSVLGIRDKWQFHCLFNFWALLFGPFWYAGKGMWVKFAVLFIIWYMLLTMNTVTAWLVPYLHLYCAILANSDYFILKVAKSEAVKKDPKYLGDYVKESYFNQILDNPKRRIIEPLFATLVALVVGLSPVYFIAKNVLISQVINDVPSYVCDSQDDCLSVINEQLRKIKNKEGIPYLETYKLACAYAKYGPAGYSRAISAANSVLKENPKFIPAKLLKTLMHFKMRQYGLARNQYEQILKENPRMYELNYNIGLCYYMEKKYAPALISFDAAIKKLPFDAKSFQYRGMTKFYMGDKKAAKADLELARKYYGSSSSVETQRQIQVIDQYLKWLSKY